MPGLRSSRPGLGQEVMWRGLKGWGCWRTGDCRGPWITEAMDEGEKRFSYPLLGKQSTKPLKQSGCIAHASVRSWHTEQISCPEGYVSLSSVCIMKTLRAGGRYYVGLLKPLCTLSSLSPACTFCVFLTQHCFTCIFHVFSVHIT